MELDEVAAYFQAKEQIKDTLRKAYPNRLYNRAERLHFEAVKAAIRDYPELVMAGSSILRPRTPITRQFHKELCDGSFFDELIREIRDEDRKP